MVHRTQINAPECGRGMEVIMTYKQRNEEIYKLRQDGKKLAEIADLYGISVSRVREIIHKHERMKMRKKTELDCFPIRLRNALLRYGARTMDDVEQILQILQSGKPIRNIGEKSIRIMEEEVKKHNGTVHNL